MHSDVPAHLPPLSLLLDDLGNPSAVDLARHLGVTTRTVFRWLKDDEAPRAVALALFWETKWGRSAVECRAVNDAVLQAQLARCRQDEAEKRLAQVQHLLAVGNFGSANVPLADATVKAIRPPAAQDHGPRPADAARQAPFPGRQRVKRAASGAA